MGLNRYAYAGNNPVMKLDPRGLSYGPDTPGGPLDKEGLADMVETNAQTWDGRRVSDNIRALDAMVDIYDKTKKLEEEMNPPGPKDRLGDFFKGLKSLFEGLGGFIKNIKDRLEGKTSVEEQDAIVDQAIKDMMEYPEFRGAVFRAIHAFAMHNKHKVAGRMFAGGAVTAATIAATGPVSGTVGGAALGLGATTGNLDTALEKGVTLSKETGMSLSQAEAMAMALEAAITGEISPSLGKWGD